MCTVDSTSAAPYVRKTQRCASRAAKETDQMTKMKGGPADTGGPVEVPEQLSILPLRNSVLFPGSIIPIDVGRRKSVRLVEDAIAKERPVIGILTQKDARTEDPQSGDLFMVGCAARILKVIKLAKD